MQIDIWVLRLPDQYYSRPRYGQQLDGRVRQLGAGVRNYHASKLEPEPVQHCGYVSMFAVVCQQGRYGKYIWGEMR